MISKQLLDILVCPETKQKLRPIGDSELADINGRIKTKGLKNRGGTLVTEVLSGALLRMDGKCIYPIRDNIPVMLIEESFLLGPDSQ